MVPRPYDDWHDILPLLDEVSQPVNVLFPGRVPGQVCVFAARIRHADVSEWIMAPERAPAGD